MAKPISISFLDELEWLTPMENQDNSIAHLLEEWEKVKVGTRPLVSKS